MYTKYKFIFLRYLAIIEFAVANAAAAEVPPLGNSMAFTLILETSSFSQNTRALELNTIIEAWELGFVLRSIRMLFKEEMSYCHFTPFMELEPSMAITN